MRPRRQGRDRAGLRRGDTEPAWIVDKRWDLAILGCAVAAFVVTYLALYPRTYSTSDDGAYLTSAYALRHGTVYLDSLHQDVVHSFTVGGHLVSKYPLGMPVVLAFTSLFGWTATLGTNLLVLLAILAVVAWLLHRRGVPALFACLVLLHPTAVLYSRTVMADLLSGLLIAGAFAALTGDRKGWSGLLLGAAVLVRDANVLACLTFPVGWAWHAWRSGAGAGTGTRERLHDLVRGLSRFAAGMLPGAVLAATGYVLVGGGQALGHTGSFGLSFLPSHLTRSLVGLIVLYPAMLFAPLLVEGRERAVMILTTFGFVVLYGLWYYQDAGRTPLETLVVSQRFLLVVMPLFVLAYAEVLWRLAGRLRLTTRGPLARAALATAAVSALVGTSLVVQLTHQRHADNLAAVRSRLLAVVAEGDLLVCDGEVGKLLVPPWGRRHTVIVGPDSDSTALRATVRAWASGPRPAGSRALLATWNGGGLAGEVYHADVAAFVGRLLPTRSVEGRLQAGLPNGFQLRELGV